VSEHSAIEWTATVDADGTVTPGATWNPLLGCTKVSQGCASCYAIGSAWVKQHNPNPKVSDAYAGLVEKRPDGSLNWTGKVNLLPERLAQPLHWVKPRRIIVNSLSDLFHEQVPDAFIDRVVTVMALASQHTFQVLTKRPERMAAYMQAAPDRLRDDFAAFTAFFSDSDIPQAAVNLDTWPLPNVWLGASTEDQATADERIPHLLRTPAAIRFLSCEPLLGPVNLHPWMGHWIGVESVAGPPIVVGARSVPRRIRIPKLQWVIAGGESGRNARPMHPDWARSLRDQCQAARVAYFMKQWGEWLPGEVRIEEAGYFHAYHQDGSGPDGHQGKPDHWWQSVDTRRPDLPGVISTRVGKHIAGRLLDGRTWDDFPEPAGVPA
jgi:protein gp37